MRQCSKCKEWKEESGFYADKRKKSGCQARCKDCHDEDSRNRQKRYGLQIETKQPPPNSEFGDTGNKEEVFNA